MSSEMQMQMAAQAAVCVRTEQRCCQRVQAAPRPAPPLALPAPAGPARSVRAAAACCPPLTPACCRCADACWQAAGQPWCAPGTRRRPAARGGPGRGNQQARVWPPWRALRSCLGMAGVLPICPSPCSALHRGLPTAHSKAARLEQKKFPLGRAAPACRKSGKEAASSLSPSSSPISDSASGTTSAALQGRSGSGGGCSGRQQQPLSRRPGVRGGQPSRQAGQASLRCAPAGLTTVPPAWLRVAPAHGGKPADTCTTPHGSAHACTPLT